MGCNSWRLGYFCCLALGFAVCSPDGIARADDAARAGSRRPNILFILTDDQAPTAVGVTGNEEIRTPHLDALFRHGAQLTNAFVTTPVCSPARAALITSRYASELGIYDWINPRTEQEHGLDPQTPTWPKLLTAAGYRCGLVGKWHLGTADRFHPTKLGYGHFMGFRSGGTTVKDPVLEIDGKEKKLAGFTTDILTDHAIEFIEDNQAQPFALSLHYRAPHSPWLPVRDEDWAPYADLDPTLPDPDWPKLDTARVKKMTREYYASVSGVDRNVGRLLARLKALGLEERTVVIFTSDHGYNLGHNAVWYKGNARWMLTELPPKTWPHIGPRERPNLFDQSLRVPAAVRWPGVVEPGSEMTHTVSQLDWFPTILDIAGVKLPPEILIRGRSIVPLLRGEDVDWNDDLYTEYSIKHGPQTHMRGYRTPTWKLMVDYKNPGRAELYHLKADPTEKTNLIDSSDPEAQCVRSELEKKIADMMRAISDKLVADLPAAY